MWKLDDEDDRKRNKRVEQMIENWSGDEERQLIKPCNNLRKREGIPGWADKQVTHAASKKAES